MNSRYKTGEYRLFAAPSFWSGAARVLDLGGTFDVYRTSGSDELADERALAADWAVVGGDLDQTLRPLHKA